VNRRIAIGALARAAAAVTLVLVVGCGGSGTSRAASYTAKDLATGADVSVAALRGSPALLVSWATWCRECDAELSGLQDFAESPASDVIDEIKAKIDRHALTTTLWRDKRNEFKRAFGALGVPTTVLLDANGVVVGTFPGAVDFHEQRILDALARVRAT
jgi:peroxiredoxin